MTTLSPWNITLADFTCSSTLLEVAKVSSEQENLPSMVRLDINGVAFGFTFEDQTNSAEKVDTSSEVLSQAKQLLQFNPPLTLADGSYPVSISFQMRNETGFSYSTDLEPINLTGCINTNSEDNNINENATSTTVTNIESQTEEIPTPTSTVIEPITATWMIETLMTQTETSLQASPTISSDESISNEGDLDGTQSMTEGQEQNTSHDSYVKEELKSALPPVILVCLLGLVIYFIVRRYRKVRGKRERSAYHVYDDEFNASEEGRH